MSAGRTGSGLPWAAAAPGRVTVTVATVAFGAGLLVVPWLVLPVLLADTATRGGLQALMTGAALVVTMLYAHRWARLRAVRLEDEGLWISRRSGEPGVVVPYKAIGRVTQRRRRLLHDVAVEFRYPTAAGNRVHFRPSREAGFAVREHDIVGELRRRAERADAPNGAICR